MLGCWLDNIPDSFRVLGSYLQQHTSYSFSSRVRISGQP